MTPVHRVLASVVLCLLGTGAALTAQSADTLQPQDQLNITVADQPTLTRKYLVEADGHVRLPLIGSVPAAGMTAEQLANDLNRRFERFFKDPQVRVELERIRRVFVFGGVNAPGMYPMTENMTLMEVLARSGYVGASEALIVRSKGGSRAPAMPDEKGAEVIRVNLREFEKDLENGQLSRNVVLADGDTIYVPRFDPNRVYVSGQVRTPGAYSVAEKTTVFQALALAGGPTERASLGRVQIMRLVSGKQTTIRARLEDAVRPGDTIIVPERYF